MFLSFALMEFAFAEEFTIDGINYSCDETCTVTGYTGKVTEANIKEDINGKKVREIKASAFNNNTNLTSVTIPAYVTSIGSSAFTKCYSLQTLNFAGESTLQTISSSAFANDTALRSVTIPASVTSIGTSAFYKCSSLQTLDFAAGSTLQTISDRAFEMTAVESVTIPASVTSIGNSAFNLCTSLKSITFSDTDSITIDGYAFSLVNDSYKSVRAERRIEAYQAMYDQIITDTVKYGIEDPKQVQLVLDPEDIRIVLPADTKLTVGSSIKLTLHVEPADVYRPERISIAGDDALELTYDWSKAYKAAEALVLDVVVTGKSISPDSNLTVSFKSIKEQAKLPVTPSTPVTFSITNNTSGLYGIPDDIPDETEIVLSAVVTDPAGVTYSTLPKIVTVGQLRGDRTDIQLPFPDDHAPAGTAMQSGKLTFGFPDESGKSADALVLSGEENMWELSGAYYNFGDDKIGMHMEWRFMTRTEAAASAKVVPLPEDGVGAYMIDPLTGEKEYLLFHTYEICMQWLGDDAKCRDWRYCYGKDMSLALTRPDDALFTGTNGIYW